MERVCVSGRAWALGEQVRVVGRASWIWEPPCAPPSGPGGSAFKKSSHVTEVSSSPLNSLGRGDSLFLGEAAQHCEGMRMNQVTVYKKF